MPAYLITFSAYGHHLPGQSSAVDRNHNLFGSPFREPRPRIRQAVEHRLLQQPFEMDDLQRKTVCDAIVAVCGYKHWELLAVHVRSNHVHVVVDADVAPERAMNAFKAYASRALNQQSESRERKRWARHGSKRYLWDKQAMDAAVVYVLDGQGERMAWYEAVFRLSAP